MSLTVVGSVALDTITTPFGKVEKAEGGSATYASLAASYFTVPHLVGIVGNDTYDRFQGIFSKRGVEVTALVKATGDTFHWEGEYHAENLNEAVTHSTCLNVFADFSPQLPENYCQNPGLLLGNIAPGLQMSVLDQCSCARVKSADTMNFWINGCPELVWKVIPRVDILFINQQEALSLTKEKNVHLAAARIMATGLKWLVLKKGEYGVTLYEKDKMFFLPALPVTKVVDPTGAGDCFAGGFMGYVCDRWPLTFSTLKKACFYGTVMASFNIEDFSIRNIMNLSTDKIEQRVRQLSDMINTGDLS